MKIYFKLFTIFWLILLSSIYARADATEIVFHNANQFTLRWDKVTEDTDSDPITGVTYEILMVNAVSDPGKLNPAIVATPVDTFATITISVKGRYYVGVRSVWDGERSEVNWADLPDGQEVPEFGVCYIMPPKMPVGLKKD